MHPFETIRKWSELPEDELLSAVDEPGSINILFSAIDLLIDNPGDLNQYTIDEYPFIVKKLQQLIRSGSWDLGEAIIKAADFAKTGSLEKAVAEMEKFKALCKSPFYRQSADKHILGLKRKF